MRSFIADLAGATATLFVAPALGALAGFFMAFQRFLYIVARFVFSWNKPILLKDTVVVVTGAAGGFGSELTRRLIEKGAIVYALDVVSNDVAAEKLPQTERCIYQKIDITDNKQLEKFANSLRKKGLTVYALVNNAGITGQMTAAAQSSPEVTGNVMAVNFTSAVELTRLLFDIKNPLFQFNSQTCVAGEAPRRSRVINVTSMAGLTATGGMSNYCASKHALEAFSDSTRIECNEKYIDVSLIEPFFAVSGVDHSLMDESETFEGSILKENFEKSRKKFQKALASSKLMSSAFVVEYIMAALTDARPQDRYVVCPLIPELAVRIVMHLPNYFGIVDYLKKRR